VNVFFVRNGVSFKIKKKNFFFFFKVESTNPEHNDMAQVLLDRVLSSSRTHTKKTFRVGISGPPGAGKSTFIEQLGQHIIKNVSLCLFLLFVFNPPNTTHPSSTKNALSWPLILLLPALVVQFSVIKHA
jgi:ribosome biogenesis GTPase A